MQTDIERTLALLALRMLGDRALPTEPALRALKKGLDRARADHLVEDVTEIVTTVSPATGKEVRKKVKKIGLTAEGQRQLGDSDPAALAATQQGHLAAVRHALDADRQALRAEVLAAVAKFKPPKPEKGLEQLAKKLDELAAVLNKLGGAAAAEDPIVARIDAGFQRLLDKLEGRGQPTEPVLMPTETTAAQPTTQTPAAEVGSSGAGAPP
ncbi:MAG: hypothetical protein ACJ8F7_10135 [Gemmataceae bacterium]